MHPPLHEFVEKLISKLPGNLKVLNEMFTSVYVYGYIVVQVVYFTNSGGEANELAMMMARLHTGAFDIVTMR